MTGRGGRKNWDHFYPLYGEPEGPHFECWTMGATSRVEIGALVTCDSYRNPVAGLARRAERVTPAARA